MPTQPPNLSEPSLVSAASTPLAEATPEGWLSIDDAFVPHNIGNYQILEEVARGGMGVVFKARDARNGNIVALKTIRMDRDLSPEMTQRFEREIQAAQQLKHANVVPIHDVGHDGRRAYFTMDLIKAGNLAQHRRRFQDSPRAAVAMLAKVARGVHHAHEIGILHRDLKPGNILLGPQDEPLVSDFGLARFLDTEMELTRTGQAVGTPGYMAPEQAVGRRKQIGPRTDIWSLGVILYELLTGRRPFLSEDNVDLVQQIQNEQPPSLRSLRPGLDPTLDAIVLKCLEKDPADRYGSALELAGDLESWLLGKTISFRKPPLFKRMRGGLRRHPWLSLMCFLAVGAAVLTPLLLYWSDRDRSLRSLERKLAAGEAVELIGDGGPPAWFKVKSGNIHRRIDVSRDGFFSIDSFSSVGLVELLPDPQLERYRLHGWIRQNDNAEDGMVGFYFGHNLFTSGDDKSYYYVTLAFSETHLWAQQIRADVFQQPETPARGPMQIVDLPIMGQLAGPSGLQTWRKIAVDVFPEKISAWSGDTLIGSISRQSFNMHAKHLHTNNAPTFSPRDGLGLFVYRGSASFKSIVIEPLSVESK